MIKVSTLKESGRNNPFRVGPRSCRKLAPRDTVPSGVVSVCGYWAHVKQTRFGGGVKLVDDVRSKFIRVGTQYSDRHVRQGPIYARSLPVYICFTPRNHAEIL